MLNVDSLRRNGVIRRCDAADIEVGSISNLSNIVIEVCRRGVDAPLQFTQLNEELRNLSRTLSSLETHVVDQNLSNSQFSSLNNYCRTCNELLNQIQSVCDQYSFLEKDESGNSARRVWKTLHQVPEEVTELCSRLKASTSLFQILVEDLNHHIIRLSVMEASAADSAPALDPTSIPHRLRQHKNDPYHESIICWLSDFDYNQQDGYIHRVHRGTGQWFLTSTEFRCWLDGTNETLFCPGVPGAGKTMLTSLTIDYLWRQYEASPEIGIGFLYCSKWRQRLTSESLMLDLLKQLVQAQTTLCHDVRIMYQSCAAFSRGPSKFDVARAIRAVVNEYSKVYLVVDALDQLDDEVRKCFLNDLFLLQEETGLNILATARIFLGSDASFPNGITRTLEVSASDEDISACVNYARDLPSYVSNDPVLLRQITRQIVSSAKGVFLLAVLHVEILRHKSSSTEMKQALPALPSMLNDAYSELFEIMKTQDESERELATKIFFWTICAKRQLTIDEILGALSINLGASTYQLSQVPELEQIESSCVGLVILDLKGNSVYLINSTVEDYFLNMKMSSEWLLDAQIYITKVCLTLLCFEVFSKQLDPSIERMSYQKWSPLYNYASQYWGEHASGSTQKYVCSLSMQFFSKPANLAVSVRAVMYIKSDDDWVESGSAVDYSHLCAHFDLPDLLKKASSKFKFNIDVRDAASQTPIFWAARRGSKEMTALLLSLRASQTTSTSKRGRTPLYEAARRGHLAVVKLLMAQDDAPVRVKTKYGSTMLHAAASNGHTEIVKFLVEGGNFDVNETDDETNTPLHRAAGCGYLAAVEFLVKQKGILINAKNHVSQTPLHLAAIGGFEDVTEFLSKQKDIEVDSKDSLGRTSLLWTALQQYNSLFRFLAAQENVRIDSRDDYDRTPLSYLAQLGNIKLVQFITKQPDVSIDEKDTTGRTPFSYAAESMSFSYVVESMNPAMARLLAEQEAIKSTPEMMSYEYPSTLTYDTERRHLSTVQYLADHVDVHIDSHDRNGRTPLSFSAERGYESVVKFLTEHVGVQVDSKGFNGRTPLSYAASRGRESMIAILAKRDDVEIDSKDIDGRTPLSYAAASGSLAAVTLLLSQGSSHADAKDQIGRTPLSYAAESGNLALVSFFIDQEGVRVDEKDINGKTPLWWAMRWNSEAVMDFLVSHGAKSLDGLYEGRDVSERRSFL